MPETADRALRLAVYARVSTEEQREGQTIDSQVAELERFSREKGWPIVGVYKDEGWSGGVMERPELDRLRDDAQKGLFQAVLINDVDRLARDVAHLGVIKRDLERHGARVIFRKLPSDTSPTYNLMVNILGSFAEFERELIADRTRRGRRHKVEVRHQYLGSNAAYGYRYIAKDPATGRDGALALVPGEAAVVRQMFEWVDIEGLSARQVLTRLNERGIPPRKGGPRWAKSSVLRILRCQTYAGVWHYNKFQSCEPKTPTQTARYRRRAKCSHRSRPRSEWLPLELPSELVVIPVDRWERVQRQLDRNISFSPRNGKHPYLLKGLLRCGACGSSYTGDPCHGLFYYRCLARCKKMPSIRDISLDEIVKSAVTDALTNPSLILEALPQLDDADEAERAQQTRCLDEIERDIKRLDAEEERLLEVFRTGLISSSQLASQLEILKAQRDGIEVERSRLDSGDQLTRHEAEKAIVDYCDVAARNIKEFTFEQWRLLLRTIICSVTFCGDHVKIQGRISFAGDSVSFGYTHSTSRRIA